MPPADHASIHAHVTNCTILALIAFLASLNRCPIKLILIRANKTSGVRAAVIMLEQLIFNEAPRSAPADSIAHHAATADFSHVGDCPVRWIRRSTGLAEVGAIVFANRY